MKFVLSPSGRSGAALEVPVDVEMVPAVNAGAFAWKSIIGPADEGGYSHLQRRKGVVIKKNADARINDIELAVTSAYAERGFTVPAARKIDETTLEIQRVDGFTLAEELFYGFYSNPGQVADGLTKEIYYSSHSDLAQVIHRLRDTFLLARDMNTQLPDILTAEQKDYLLERQHQKLLREGVSIEDAARRPLSSRVDARSKKLQGVNVESIVYKTLTALEEVLRPLTDKYSSWSLESNGNNFIGDTRIDMNGIYHGVDDDSFLLDTPYMLSDRFWIRRRDEPHLSEYRWVEQSKNQWVFILAQEQGENPMERRELFQGSRVFRNILQLFYAYNNALGKKEEAERGNPLAQAKLYQHLNEMFAHYEMQDTGLNSVSAYHHVDNSTAAHALRENALSYSTALEDMMRQMCSVVLPDSSKLGEYAQSFTFIRENYKELKQNCPFDV